MRYSIFCDGLLSCAQKGTNWTEVWKINAYVMMLQSANFVFLTFGAFFFWPRYFGTICNCCCACFAHLTAIITAMMGRWGAAGDNCAMNIAPVKYKDSEFDSTGRTYEDDANLMSTFIGL